MFRGRGGKVLAKPQLALGVLMRLVGSAVKIPPVRGTRNRAQTLLVAVIWTLFAGFELVPVGCDGM